MENEVVPTLPVQEVPEQVEPSETVQDEATSA